MARWIILLRGVNVSGKNKVPMAEWKAGLAALGYTCLLYTSHPRSGAARGAVWEGTRRGAPPPAAAGGVGTKAPAAPLGLSLIHIS